MRIIHRVRRFFAGQRILGVSLVVIVALALYVFVFRTQYYQSNAVMRSAGANAWLERGFTVAIVWPPHSAVSLVEGVQLAFDEIQPSSPLYGKMQLKFFTETDDGGALARQIAGVPDILAVIGHEFDGPTIPASITYEDHGMLFIAPKSTDKRLTQHEFRYTFRLTPEDEDMTKALANFAVSKGWNRVGALYGRVDHGESATRQFLTASGNVGLAIPFMRSFFHELRWQAQDFRPMIGTFRSQQFDALMVADQLPWAAKLLMDMVTMGVTQPVIATDKLDSMQVWQLAGKAANNLYVASSVDPESNEPRYRAFRERFTAKYGVEPGYGSSQGYEAMSLLIAAIEKSGSADPVVIATTLRTNPWAGLFGQVTFDESGDVVGRTISVKRMFEGAFTTVSSVKVVQEEVK